MTYTERALLDSWDFAVAGDFFLFLSLASPRSRSRRHLDEVLPKLARLFTIRSLQRDGGLQSRTVSSSEKKY